ncbi:MAG: hypothetical protein RBS80_21965, partial [Thermoguttaceae bacterium]|nr:hypothetical protein [Thermoguttaceae bacterium]
MPQMTKRDVAWEDSSTADSGGARDGDSRYVPSLKLRFDDSVQAYEQRKSKLAEAGRQGRPRGAYGKIFWQAGKCPKAAEFDQRGAMSLAVLHRSRPP